MEMMPMARTWRIWLGVAAAAVLTSGPGGVGAAAEEEAGRAGIMRLLEDIEQVRMLLGAAMWEVHDLRNAALSGAGDVADIEALDRGNLRLYETLKPLDYGASSLLAATDCGDTAGAAGDLAMLREELGPVAAEVLTACRGIAARREEAVAALRAAGQADGLVVKTIPGRRWRDPVRERMRRLGVQVGWRTNIEPGEGFRERLWNERQRLDIRYQLDKGRMIGVDFLVPKDPILRWDWIEPEKGRYDFSRLDRFMALAAEYGYRVKLVLPTFGGRVPDWLLAERPESVVRDDQGKADFLLNGGTFAHDFMGPIPRDGEWYHARAVNLADEPTRAAFARYVAAVGRHCREQGYRERILAVTVDVFHAQRNWRAPAGADLRAFVVEQYGRVAEIARAAFAPVPLDLEVTDGEAHFVDTDLSAHEWRSVGLTEVVDIPGVASETPFFEDLMRAAALETARGRAVTRDAAGPFFHQNCEYGFGTMLSVNFFTSLLRDGLWSDGWFGPEGPLRWGYFPQIMTWNDRQLQWSGITNGWLAFRQAHRLGPTVANTRVAPADVVLALPSSSFGVAPFQPHRELVGWGWALSALKVPYDVLSEQRLAAGVPERARLLILPQAAVLGEAQAAAVREFVGRGGLLIASLVPGADGTRPGPLADVLGCDRLVRDGQAVTLTQTGVAGTWLQTTVNRGLHSGKYQPVPEPDTGYPRKVEGRRGQHDVPFQALAPAAAAAVVARFGGGEPAIVENAFGKGRAQTLGYPYGNEILFADWTSIAFGKIYNGWARDRQIIEMVRWLRDDLDRLGYVRQLAVPEGWRHRLQGFEAAVSSLSYPKGPAAEAGDYFVTRTYLDPRPGHAIVQEHDDMDYAAELTWRDRPGVGTRYLAVANRESAYAGERATVQFWMMPHVLRIRINDPAVRRVYDVAAGMPVHVERDAGGVNFRTTVPPAEGRIFAVSRTDTVEVFEGDGVAGVDAAAVAGRVEGVARAGAALPPTRVVEPDRIRGWLDGRRGGRLTVCYGDEAYRAAAERVAAWLRQAAGIEASVTAEDGRFEIQGQEGFQIVYQAAPADVLIGSAWTNNAVAMLDSTWPYNTGEAPAIVSGRLSATYAWPGGERGVALLTREREFRRDNHTTWGTSYGNTDGFDVRQADDAQPPHLRRRLLILASTPAGADQAVRALEQALPPAP